MIAVKGFKSPLWAIRNSSMMVFSSVVQRTVDNDKRESGGIRAATASDYFHRFPSLFPFLLSGELTCCLINVSCV
jgi:thyroid adenoma-associated protein